MKIYDWKEFLLQYYKKVDAKLKLFDNYHFRVTNK